MMLVNGLLSIVVTFVFCSCAHMVPSPNQVPPKALTSSNSSSIYVSESVWTDQHGRKVEFNKLVGTPRLMSMVFTRCPSACPLLISDMKRVQSGLSVERRKQVRFTVFSFDSKHDTPETLRAFTKKMNLDGQWDLFVSDPGSTTEVAALLDIQFKELPSGDFVHSNRLVAFDEHGLSLGEKRGLGGSVNDTIKALK